MLFSKESIKCPLKAPAMVGAGRDGGGKRKKGVGTCGVVSNPIRAPFPRKRDRPAHVTRVRGHGVEVISARSRGVQKCSAYRHIKSSAEHTNKSCNSAWGAVFPYRRISEPKQFTDISEDSPSRYPYDYLTYSTSL